ncbi:MAG: hypothetical protein KAS32_04935 [Candidatus Peribacteraceae bacterium]|nr:hypothetical protein [Candidatus Peribacteraceae bacterium]
MTKQLKYTFERRKWIRTGIRLTVEVFAELKKIVEREGVDLQVVADVLMGVAVKEYWEERKVKKPKKARKIGVPSRRTIEPRKSARIRAKGVLKGGMSFCQYSKCPKRGATYLRKNMIKYDGLVFHSGDCKVNHIKEEGHIKEGGE